MDLIGLAEEFVVSTPFGGVYTIETDFWESDDPADGDKVCVIHQCGGPYGNDVGKTVFNEGVGSLSTTPTPRAPAATQSCPWRFPYIFTDGKGTSYMTGNKTNATGSSCLLYFGGAAYPEWFDAQSQPIFTQDASGAYSWLANVPVLPLPNGQWLAAAEIAGGTAFSLADSTVSPISFDAGRTPSFVIPGAGNGCLRMHNDQKTVILWTGIRSDPTRFGGSWYTTVATAKVADLCAAGNLANPANWTIHNDRFAIGKNGVDICDPSVLDGPNGARIMVSYAQNSQRLLSSSRSLRSIVDDLIAA